MEKRTSTILIADSDIHARMQIMNCLKKLIDDVKYIEALDCKKSSPHAGAIDNCKMKGKR